MNNGLRDRGQNYLWRGFGQRFTAIIKYGRHLLTTTDRITGILVAAIAAIFSSGVAAAQVVSNSFFHWETGSGPLNVASFQTLAEGNGRFVLGGTLGWTLVSEDGVTWRTNHFGLDHFQRISFGNNRFVAITDAAHSQVLISTNGLDWAAHDPPETFYPPLIHALGEFVVFGISNVFTSSDGISWSKRATVPAVLVEGKGPARALAPYKDGFAGIGKDFFRTDPDFTSLTVLSAAPCLPETIASDGVNLLVSGGGPVGVYRLDASGTAWTRVLSPKCSLSQANGLFLAITRGTAPAVPAFSTVRTGKMTRLFPSR